MNEGDTGAERTRKPGKKRSDGRSAVLVNIESMPERDRVMATRLHAIVEQVAPSLSPKLWYGMPAYARDGKVVCFFQSASKFGSRYATLGFDESATLDDGAMWPTSFALTEMGDTEAAFIEALIRKATSS